MSVLEIPSNIVKKVGIFFSRLFEKDVVVKITSLAAAIVIWFVISVSAYPTMKKPVYSIPVQIALEGTYADSNGLQAMSISAETVNIVVEGKREQVGNLTADELIAVASAENVMYAMEYNLPLEIICSSGKEFEVESIEPSSVTVDFDEIISKEIVLTPELSGISAADGYFIDGEDSVIVVPNIVTVTGPAEIVKNVTKASAVVSEDASLTKTEDFKTSAIKLYRGNAVVSDEDKERLSFDKTDFTVHVPVFGRKTVKLNVRITNAPDGFDTNKFMEQLELSVDEIEVAVPNELVNDNETEILDIGVIDMREVDIGKEFTFAVDSFLPDGYLDKNEIGTVTVKCPSEGLVRRAIHITNPSIQLVNVPSRYDFRIVTSGVTPIFIGPEESMEKLTYIDIIAQVDMLNGLNVEEGESYLKLPVTFSIPAFDDVWCIGTEDGALSPRVTVQVTAKE
ncbi:MAG: hypothetical protein K2J73_10605 [Oscillospiraceae bacterium]|nr:hypothetical protein [Oscillospiraceae bacterium]